MAASTATGYLTPEQYLRSTFEGDMDYVDGYLEDRNVGEWDHWTVQRVLVKLLESQEQTGGFQIAQEVRVQVAPTRFRVPDTCLIAAGSKPNRIIREAPLVCIEVLSPEDRLPRMRIKVQDYFNMGVPEVWIIDSRQRSVLVMQPGSEKTLSGGTIQAQAAGARLEVGALFASLSA